MSRIHSIFSNNSYESTDTRISVVTPVYNSSETIFRAYSSLMQQTYRDFEWIIVDDGSTDKLFETINGFFNKTVIPILFIRKENGGVHTARNCAIHYARGEFIMLLDADDEYLPDAMNSLIKMWDTVNESNNYVGIKAQCITQRGEIAGTLWQENINELPWETVRQLFYRSRGEYRGLFLTELLKSNPWPEPERVSFVRESILWRQLDKEHMSYFTNDIVMIYHTDSAYSLSKTRERTIQYYINKQWESVYMLNRWKNYNDTEKYSLKLLNACVFGKVLKIKKIPQEEHLKGLNRFLELCLTVPCYLYAKIIIKKHSLNT